MRKIWQRLMSRWLVFVFIITLLPMNGLVASGESQDGYHVRSNGALDQTVNTLAETCQIINEDSARECIPLQS